MRTFITACSDFLWGPGTLALLLGTGAFLTVRLRFLPWRNLGFALGLVLKRPAAHGRGISPFSALMTALSATIGTGNIVGVATALTAGGPGALVWMELAALVGLSTKYAECLLAVKFRTRDRQGDPCGGPMYVMRQTLGSFGAVLGGCYALFALLTALGVGGMTQSNSIAQTMAPRLPPLLCGTAVALLAFFILLGGIGRIAAVSNLLVPLMAAAYVLVGLSALYIGREQLGPALAEIFKSAFSPRSALGGTAGAALTDALRWGTARGVFSNEAGLGSAAISAAAVAGEDPARQGYISMTGVVFDTFLVCTLTGLVLCCSGVMGEGGALNGGALTALAFQRLLGPWGGRFVGGCIVLFAFSTVLGWEYQGERCFVYLLGERFLPLYRLLFPLTALAGAMAPVELVFSLADICNALMCLPNLVTLLLLSGVAARETEAFQSRRRRKSGAML